MASSPELSVFGDSATSDPVLTPVSNHHNRDSEMLTIMTKPGMERSHAPHPRPRKAFQLNVSAVSSRTKLVCSEESSVPLNETVTV
jgi:hypothetical protein